jgi:hypothetical protein
MCSEVHNVISFTILSIDLLPVELRECVLLEELSLEYNKLIRPLLDFRLIIHKTNFAINSVTSSRESEFFIQNYVMSFHFLTSCTKVLSLIIYLSCIAGLCLNFEF